jgi:hypothetical protein
MTIITHQYFSNRTIIDQIIHHMRKKIVLLGIFLFQLIAIQEAKGQEGASISGSIQTNANIFLRDTSINAFQQPQYKNQFFGGENWINLNYNYGTLSAGIRYDMFVNSNLRNPNDSYTDQGLGRWYIKKKFEKLTAEVGYIYDQVGSGIIYRAYEQRPLFIDNALLGVNLKYQFNDHFTLKGFAGRQKNAFEVYSGNIKGLVLDGFFSLGKEANKVNIIPGIGVVNKTLSDETIEKIVGSVSTYLPQDRFEPVYNNIATTIYNTVNYKNFNWYIETAFKNKDVYFNPFASKSELNGVSTNGKLEFKPGAVIYSSVSLSGEKLAVTLEGKRTQRFNYRIDPNLQLLRGLISYIPPMNRQNTYRLTARYAPATQEISEQAVQVDVRYAFNKKVNILLNTSTINTIEGTKLFSEYLGEITLKPNPKTQLIAGLQVLNYNQQIYEAKPEVPMVKATTPYIDFLYKISKKQSIRTELQYMATQQDFGSWMFAQLEYSIAPRWIFEASGMYNSDPKKALGNSIKPQKLIYPAFGATYSSGPNRYQIKYVKQVEGIVCSGGICRLEPAFSGVKFTMNSSF